MHLKIFLCWGDLSFKGQAEASEGSFLTLSSGLDHTCAIDLEGQISCWGGNDYLQSDAPQAGISVAISSGAFLVVLWMMVVRFSAGETIPKINSMPQKE